MSGNCSRRQVLLAVAAAGVGAAIPRAVDAADHDAAVAAAFAELMTDRAGAAALGRHYQLGSFARADSLALGRKLLASPAARRAFLDANDAERRAVMQSRIVADFRSGRTVEVDGWLLAETEALLCAVCAAE